MSGRFFAMPFLVAVVALVRLLRDWNYRWPAAAGLVLYNVLIPLVPAKTTASYDGAWPWRSQNGVKDERGHYHRLTNIFFYSPFRELPDHTWMREGRSFRSGPDKVTVQGSIGFFGLMAGPDKHIVDRNALSDPLLARLPVSPRLYFEFYVGHYFRDIPDGYLESIASGGNQLADSDAARLLRQVAQRHWRLAAQHQAAAQHPSSQPWRGQALRRGVRAAPPHCPVDQSCQRTLHDRCRREGRGRRRDSIGRTRGLPADGAGNPYEARIVPGPMDWHRQCPRERTDWLRGRLERRSSPREA